MRDKQIPYHPAGTVGRAAVFIEYWFYNFKCGADMKQHPSNHIRKASLVLLLVLSFCTCGQTSRAGSGENGATDLIRAIRDGESKKADKLIESKSGINDRDDFGWTPLMYAVFRHDKELAEKLISRGADPDVADEDGITPLITAIIDAPQLFMLQYIPESSKASLTIAHMLIEKGADPNLADKEGSTPLVYATVRNQESIAAALILKKADPNKADRYGRTPMFFLNNPDLAAVWAPADCKLASAFQSRKIPEDQSRWTPEYAAQVAEAREQANTAMQQIRKRMADLFEMVGGAAPDPSAIRSPDTLIDSRPVKLKGVDKLGSIAANYARSQRENGAYPYSILICVAADGTVREAVVLTGIPYGASRELQKAAMKLKYKPAMKNGQPVQFWDRFTGFSAGAVRIDILR
jgi:hypothetical protein